jgi:hypothetical protein
MKKIYLSILFVSVLSAKAQQWEPTKGPYGGSITSFYQYNQAIYAGTTCGLFITQNDGENWSFLNLGKRVQVTAIAAMGGRVFVGTGGDGIYTSTDNENWTLLNNGLSTYYRFCGYCIRGFAVINSTIYAATGDGLFSLNNNDTLWSYVNYGYYDTFSSYGNIMVRSEMERYGPGSSSLISTNAGLNFTYINFPGTPDYNRDFAYSLDVTPSGIYAVTRNHLYFSSDNGNNWSDLYNDSLDLRPTYVKIIDNKILLATEGHGLFISDINNIAWTNVNFPYYTFKSIFKANNFLFLGLSYERGVYRGDISSLSFIEKNAGLTATRTLAITVDNNRIVTGSQSSVVISNDGGATWTKHKLRLPNTTLDKDNDFYIEEIAVKNNMILAGTSNIYDNVFFSLDSGSTWSVMPDTFSYILAGVAISNNRFIVIAWQKFLYSDDFGTTWNVGQLPPGNSLWTDLTVNSSELFICDYQHVYSSSNGGQSWDSIPVPNNTGLFWNLEATDSLLIGVNSSTGLYIGTHAGNNWSLSFQNNPNAYAAIYEVGLNYSDIFISDYHYGTVHHSSDNGNTWNADSTFLGYVFDQFGSSSSYIYGSIPGWGIWRHKSEPLTTSVAETPIINHNSAIQIFPNPTTGLLNVESKTQNAELKIYNTFGSLIHQQILKSSNQQIDLSAQPKGVYFLEVGEEKRKIVVN